VGCSISSVLVKSAQVRLRARSLFPGIHPHERVALAYFCYLALLSFFYPLTALDRLALFALPVAIWAVLRLETAASRPWSRVVRQWASLALILLAYWRLSWFGSTPPGQLELTWVRWDEQLLNNYGLRPAIESAGWIGPSILESCYLLIYAIPPISLAILYACRASDRANRHLLILFLGTFAAYALVPFFPVVPPRIAFPASVPPSYHGIARELNLSLLGRFNVAIAVFPSGHVALALSAALGLFHALRERALIWGLAFLFAFLVYVATIYGRYHYAVDGLASIVIVLAVWKTRGLWRTHEI